MFVKNNTISAMNHGGRAYGPGKTFEVSDSYAESREGKALLGSGSLEVSMTAPAKGKPSDGLNVEELKAALVAANIPFDTAAKKAELAATLDAGA